MPCLSQHDVVSFISIKSSTSIYSVTMPSNHLLIWIVNHYSIGALLNTGRLIKDAFNQVQIPSKFKLVYCFVSIIHMPMGCQGISFSFSQMQIHICQIGPCIELWTISHKKTQLMETICMISSIRWLTFSELTNLLWDKSLWPSLTG